MIAINQDPLGIQAWGLIFLKDLFTIEGIFQATCVKDCCGDGLMGANIPDVTCAYFKDSWQVWQGPLVGGAYVVMVLNR